jgi:hypothetical protein
VAKNTGHNADPEFVRLRGRYGRLLQLGRVDEAEQVQVEIDRYRRDKKIREAQAVLAAAWSEGVIR